MIRLPDGTEINAFAVGAMRTINDVQIPERDLFKTSVMIARGIKRIVRQEIANPQYFMKTGESEVETIEDGVTVVTITPTTDRKYTVTNLLKKIGDVVESTMRALYKANKIYYDELTDAESPIYDLTNTYVAEFETYRGALRTAYNTIKSDLLTIRNSGETDAVKYQQIIDYDWQAQLPTEPGDAI